MPQRPSLKIDPNSSVPVVRQIFEGILVQLVEGNLRPGDSLPSVRRVAMEIGVHFNTVAEAYRQLAADGWLDLRHGRAPRVVERVRSAPPRSKLLEFRDRLRLITTQMQAEGISHGRIAAELQALAEVFSK